MTIFAQVTRHDVLTDGVVKYTIRVYDDTENWRSTIRKRYSAIKQLHERCKEKFPEIAWFPPKKYFWRLSEDFLVERREGLDKWIQLVCGQKDIEKDENFRLFFQLGLHENRTEKPPSDEQEKLNRLIKKAEMGFIDLKSEFSMVFSEEERIKREEENREIAAKVESIQFPQTEALWDSAK